MKQLNPMEIFAVPADCFHAQLSRSTVMMLAQSVVLIAVLAVVGAADSPKQELTADGLPFTIHQKDFKLDTFELYGKTYVDTYGFVDASMLPLDNTGYSEVSGSIPLCCMPFL